MRIVSFSNQNREDKQLMKQFVQFHWELYRDVPQYIPLLDYEFTGSKIFGMKGFFNPTNPFYQHAEINFFMVYKDNKVAGRCAAVINRRHNERWNEKTGFFAHYDAIDDPEVTSLLMRNAAAWLKSKGMDTMRGPQNLPFNEATPGIMTAGFDSRPVIYYTYNYPYYEKLLLASGLQPVKRVLSWEAPINEPMEERIKRISEKVMKRYDITVEFWQDRPTTTRREEMLSIYNDAWGDNYGFIPFTREEFFPIVNDLMLVADKKLFFFIYVKGEPAAFLGAIPNIMERLVPSPCSLFHRWEFKRMLYMYLMKGRVKGFRLGYLGIKKKYHNLGLDGIMVWKLKTYSQEKGYEYSDIGWVLEDNVRIVRLTQRIQGVKPSKTYTIYQVSL